MYMQFDDGCGRFGLDTDPMDILHHYGVTTYPPPKIDKSYDISPGQQSPVVTSGDDGLPKIEMMRWGLVPSWSKDIKIGYKLFNARDDRLFSSKIWKPAVLKKRALIPATGFFEWSKPPK